LADFLIVLYEQIKANLGINREITTVQGRIQGRLSVKKHIVLLYSTVRPVIVTGESNQINMGLSPDSISIRKLLQY